MARPLRIERAGAWYHVTARGTERKVIFRDERDRQRWLGLLAEATTQFRLVVHAYVMMENHYHLIVETREANLSRALQWLQTSYSMGFNRRHRRIGPLFQGRFKAVVVDPVEWGLELSRYVHLNPVRTARLGLSKRARRADRLGARGRPDRRQIRERVQRLRAYRWSSYRAYAGLARAPEWLTCSTILELGGKGTPAERQRKYRQYVEEAVREGLKESPWEHVQGQVMLGGREFVKKLRSMVKGSLRERPQRGALTERPTWPAVVKAVERVRGEKFERLRERYGDWGRDAAWYLGRTRCGMRLTELGEAGGGADYAAVSVAIKRFRERLAADAGLRKTMQTIDTLLNVET